ncbi:MAG: protein kinase, partial [Myxococcota bacterium]
MPGTDPVGGRRFSLLRTLGEGSFGSVYLAEMEGAGGFRRRVALKLLNDSWGAGSDAARRLRDEARLLGRLEHRHIVRVDDLVQLNGRWALVMEYVSGADMERVFSWSEETGTRLSPRAVVEL